MFYNYDNSLKHIAGYFCIVFSVAEQVISLLRLPLTITVVSSNVYYTSQLKSQE